MLLDLSVPSVFNYKMGIEMTSLDYGEDWVKVQGASDSPLHVAITQHVLAATIAALCSPTPWKFRPSDVLVSLLRSANSGVVLARVMTLQQSPGVFGHGPQVPCRKPISMGGLNLGCQDHIEVRSPGPPGGAQLLECTCRIPYLAQFPDQCTPWPCCISPTTSPYQQMGSPTALHLDTAQPAVPHP